MSYGSPMPNERLRAALLENGLTLAAVADELGVDMKTVERWVGGRTPYRRHRYALSARLGVDEVYLWPDALPREQVAMASAGEVVAVYPHRSEVPREVWRRLFDAAREEIGVLVYAGLFLSEDAGLQRSLIRRAKAGVRIRFLLGDPESKHVEQRGLDEGAEGAIAAKIRSAMTTYRPLRESAGVEFRLHRTILYNSMYRADDQILVNTHLHGLPAAQAPVWHLRKIAGGELTSTYLESFDRVWKDAARWEA
jgi:transcriptional regulator with XRE-family HTH domain